MSLSQATTDDCKHCHNPIDEFYTPGYCSERCYYQHKGAKAVNILQNDHRLCTCGRQIKEIDPPSEDWQHKRQSMQEVILDSGGELVQGPEGIEIDGTNASGKRPTTTALIGFEDSTKHATDVIREYGNSEFSIQNVVSTGIGCECGNADTSFVSETLREVEISRVIANYILIFRALEREGQIDQRIDKDEFISSYKETSDIEYALGRGLHS